MGWIIPSKMNGTMAPQVIPLTVFNLGSFENFVDVMSVVTFIYWALDLPGPVEGWRMAASSMKDP